MKIDLWRCDSCSVEYREDSGGAVYFHVNNESDPVDGHNVKVHKHLDLCNLCLLRQLAKLINKMPIEEQAKLAKEWKA